MATSPPIQHLACKSLASHTFCNSHAISSICNASMFSPTRFLTPPTTGSALYRSMNFAFRPVSIASSSFTWEDAVHISLPESFQDDPSDLTGYFEKVKLCNRGSDMQSEFLPFVIDDLIVGYVHHCFAKHLKKTDAVGDVVKCFGEEVIPGTRNELYPVTSSFGGPVFISLERAAAPYFGIKVYGVQMNVAGGLPQGISCGENLMKECEEEAGIPRTISNMAIPVGAVSYSDIKDYSYKRDVLSCYDLKLPESYRRIKMGRLKDSGCCP
ncbi:unnamed protein product [Citrullus colocynthis]|uniref:DUF4743 domain-containing protein n=1 Tax=Citrullus colocynthis TaxID=252529 RepID=A0ABP0ZAP9_9ROSI